MEVLLRRFPCGQATSQRCRVDGAIHRVAGPGLRDECATLNGCSVGEAKITGAHGLPAKHVIHTVGPRSGDEELIHCYQSCFSICEERNLQTIAVPLHLHWPLRGFQKNEPPILLLEQSKKY